MIVSFRTRLFVSATLIVGAVLCAVLYLGWTRVLAFEVERLEQRLCMEARRLVTRPFDQDQLPRLQADVLAKLHLSGAQQLMLRYEPGAGAGVVQTQNWHLAFDVDRAQWRPAPSSAAPALLEPPDQLQSAHPPRRPRPGDAEGSPNQRPENRRADGQREPPRGPPSEPGVCALAAFEVAAQPWRAARYVVPSGRGVLAVDLVATQSGLQAAFTQALKLVVPLALVLAALGAWLLSALTMRPVIRLSQAMKGVNQHALDRRLSSVGEDREFKVLIDTYNTMLVRLQASFAQATRFSADAAHELKTPLTILQGRLEQALIAADAPAKQAELTELLDEVGRLATITRKLLLLSQADAGWLQLQRAPIDLCYMLDELAFDTHMLLTDQVLHSAIDRELHIQGDALLLRQLFNNLINNAVRYCSAGGWIKLSARSLPNSAGVEVVFSNSTAAIDHAQRERFFERFYRGDAAHNRRVDGTGLGLSLAREIAHAHGGELVLLASARNEVVLRLTLLQQSPSKA